MTEAERLKSWLGRVVIIDTDSPCLYAGTLVSVDDAFYEMTDVDVHDSGTTTTTRDVYIINVRKLGVKKNRERTLVRRDRVVGLSLIEDVTTF